MQNSVQSLALVGGLALAYALGAQSAVPATVPDVIRARAIQLVDEEGRTRAELAIDADGSAGLFVRDTEERVRAAVIHDASQSAFYAFDEAGTIRVGAAQFAHGGGGFALHGAESKGASVLYMAGGEGSLSLIDDEGTLRHRFPAR